MGINITVATALPGQVVVEAALLKENSKNDDQEVLPAYGVSVSSDTSADILCLSAEVLKRSKECSNETRKYRDSQHHSRNYATQEATSVPPPAKFTNTWSRRRCLDGSL
mmetsp:Transcript_229/g.281  ORF Transcript_229/g.281 Transcript_229/m.281 type:complete len:109 (-) Transcript_229:435-761(-)